MYNSDSDNELNDDLLNKKFRITPHRKKVKGYKKLNDTVLDESIESIENIPLLKKNKSLNQIVGENNKKEAKRGRGKKKGGMGKKGGMASGGNQKKNQMKIQTKKNEGKLEQMCEKKGPLFDEKH